ncbi:MAG: phosphopyruvate hydratase [Candidatus Peregrinibacteria bacterium]|nr:phosphopyruvate hydratase [Candidatus Peregrinibacteria bacterium]
MPTLQKLNARQIIDSRGNPTIEVDATLSDSSFGRASIPSGVSAGVHEALELRDGDAAVFGGKSVFKAVANVNDTIAKAMQQKDIADQRSFDQALLALDGTPNKAKLGANAILGVSMAVCRARAMSEKRSLWQSLADQYGIKNPVCLPVPQMVLVEGGVHSDAGLSFQEFMVIPDGFSRFSDAIRAGAEIFMHLKKILHKAGHSTAVGDEGACAPHLKTADEVLTILASAIHAAGYDGKVRFALDAAASEFCKDGAYTVDGKTLSSGELVAYYKNLCAKFPILSIEDSHSEDDWDGFAQLKKATKGELQLVGDDLLVTNTKRIQTAIEKDAVNAVLIKVNQIGSVTETVDAVFLTQKQGWNAIVSHRGGDTEDTFISHLAVALGTGQIKTGSLSRGERTAKYNELLRIEEELGGKAKYVSPFKS